MKIRNKRTGEIKEISKDELLNYKLGGKLNKLGVKNSLWNNIRENAGSGKKPTPEMLEQERKIKSQYANGGQTNPPIYVTNPNDPRLKLYSDSLGVYNGGKQLESLANLAVKGVVSDYNKNKHFWESSARFSFHKQPPSSINEGFYYDTESRNDYSAPTIKNINNYINSGLYNYFNGAPSMKPISVNIYSTNLDPLDKTGGSFTAIIPEYKKPVQPYILQIKPPILPPVPGPKPPVTTPGHSSGTTTNLNRTPITRPLQEEISMPTMGNINSDQQISQPINNIQPIISLPKDYVTITDPNMYRNPDTNAFQHKTYRIDKSSGKRITEPSFKNGGQVSSWKIIEDLPKAQNGKFTNPPIYVNDPKDPRLGMYNDSLNLFLAYQMQDKLMGPGSSKTNDNFKWNTADLIEGRKKRIVEGLESYGPIAKDFQSEKEQFEEGYNALTARKEDKQLLDYYKKLGFKPNQIMYHSSPDIVSDKIKAVGTYNDGTALSPIYAKPKQPYILQTTPPILPPTPGSVITNTQEFVVNTPTVVDSTAVSTPKGYVTITTGSSYRNPATGAFEQKTFKIDKTTGKRISEDTFKEVQKPGQSIALSPQFKNGGLYRMQDAGKAPSSDDPNTTTEVPFDNKTLSTSGDFSPEEIKKIKEAHWEESEDRIEYIRHYTLLTPEQQKRFDEQEEIASYNDSLAKYEKAKADWEKDKSYFTAPKDGIPFPSNYDDLSSFADYCDPRYSCSGAERRGSTGIIRNGDYSYKIEYFTKPKLSKELEKKIKDRQKQEKIKTTATTTTNTDTEIPTTVVTNTDEKTTPTVIEHSTVNSPDKRYFTGISGSLYRNPRTGAFEHKVYKADGVTGKRLTESYFESDLTNSGSTPVFTADDPAYYSNHPDIYRIRTDSSKTWNPETKKFEAKTWIENKATGESVTDPSFSPVPTTPPESATPPTYTQYGNPSPTVPVSKIKTVQGDYKNGGKILNLGNIKRLPKAQIGTTTYPLSVPTRTDSLNLYNNAMEIGNYFDKHPEYQVVVDTKKDDEEELRLAKQYLNAMNAWYKNILSLNSPPNVIKSAKDDVNRAKDRYDSLMSPLDATKANKVGVDRFNAPGRTVDLIKNGVMTEDSTLPYNEYRNDIDENQYYQREQQNGTLNLDIPMQLFDKRINPDFKKQYTNELIHDGVLLYGYNPIFIKPYDLLTPEERIIVDQKNSTNTTTAPTTRQIQEEIILPVRKNEIDNPQISKISQPIINIPTVIPPKKDYVTIKTGSYYRNPETGAFEQKTFKIDKVTGKKISEETFKNGGKAQIGGNTSEVTSDSVNGTTYSRTGTLGMDRNRLQRTVTPYTTKRDIKKNTPIPTSGQDIDFNNNYFHYKNYFKPAGTWGGGDTRESRSVKTTPTVPFEGDKHWNSEQFMLKPHLTNDYPELHTQDNTVKQNKNNVLADMYKYQMLNNPDQSQGKSFRQAKKYMRQEINPKINGEFLNAYNEGLPTSARTSMNPMLYYGDENQIINYNNYNRTQNDNPGFYENYKTVDYNELKKISKDYFKNYEDLSRRDANKKWKSWEEKAAIDEQQYNDPEYIAYMKDKKERIANGTYTKPLPYVRSDGLSDDEGFFKDNNLNYQPQVIPPAKKPEQSVSKPVIKKSNIKIVPGGYKNGGKTKKSNWQIIEY